MDWQTSFFFVSILIGHGFSRFNLVFMKARDLVQGVTCIYIRGDWCFILTVKLELPGEIFSSARTQIPLVIFMDWYNMSWPSTFRLAIVNTLLFFIRADIMSGSGQGTQLDTAAYKASVG